MLVALTILGTGCGPKKARSLSLAVQPYPGRACQEVRVGVNELEVDTRRVGCTVKVEWDLVANDQTQSIVMPVPADTSAPVTRAVGKDTIKGRRVYFGAPGLRDDDWRIEVERRAFGGTDAEQLEAETLQLPQHRYLVFVVRDTSVSGTVYPFPLVAPGKIKSTYANDPRYCRDLATAIRLYPSDADHPPQDRIFRPEDAIQPLSLVCSGTDSHVFLLDLGTDSPTTLDVVAELALRVPRIFRVQLEPYANYTVIDLTVLSQAR
ncbi:MAG: hypothetical protein H6732_14335 [Alphaproteobacteria bacterium]|nr:hypothetical protein [Alphaproteobacteria bacterium]